MKALFPFLLAGGIVTAPFFFTRRPWAVRLWRRARLFLIAYVLVIVLSAVMTLVLHWGDIYG